MLETADMGAGLAPASDEMATPTIHGEETQNEPNPDGQVQDTQSGVDTPQETESAPASSGLWGFAAAAFTTIKSTSTSLVETAVHEISEFSHALNEETRELMEERRKLAEQEKKQKAQDDRLRQLRIEAEKASAEAREAKDALDNGHHSAPESPVENDPEHEGTFEFEEKLINGVVDVSKKIGDVGSSLWGKTAALLPTSFAIPALGGGNDDSDEETDDEKARMFEYLQEKKERLKELQEDQRVYTKDPSDTKGYERFKAVFVPSFDLVQRVKMEKVLETQPLVKAQYEELVPSIVKEEVFWCRYVYSVKVLDRQERKKLESRLNMGGVSSPLDSGATTPSPRSPAPEVADLRIRSDPPKKQVRRVPIATKKMGALPLGDTNTSVQSSFVVDVTEFKKSVKGSNHPEEKVTGPADSSNTPSLGSSSASAVLVPSDHQPHPSLSLPEPTPEPSDASWEDLEGEVEALASALNSSIGLGADDDEDMVVEWDDFS